MITERQNGKVREQRQVIEERTTQMGDDVKTLKYQAERARKENDIRYFLESYQFSLKIQSKSNRRSQN